MIGFLRGLIKAKQPPSLLLDVAGVGYEIETSMTTFYTLPEVGETTSLFTHLVIRDDAHLLFGFAQKDEQTLFRALIKVNGVGAKLALALLSGMTVQEFALCLMEKDIHRLTQLPGVGKKTAERLLIEMADKCAALPLTSSTTTDTAYKDSIQSPLNDAISALVALGYKPQDAARYARAVAGDGKSREAIIRAALQGLGK